MKCAADPVQDERFGESLFFSHAFCCFSDTRIQHALSPNSTVGSMTDVKSRVAPEVNIYVCLSVRPRGQTLL